MVRAPPANPVTGPSVRRSAPIASVHPFFRVHFADRIGPRRAGDHQTFHLVDDEQRLRRLPGNPVESFNPFVFLFVSRLFHHAPYESAPRASSV